MGRSTKDKRDIYYRRAKEEGWRARSAFKLLQIDDKLNIFQGVRRAVDLCAAPGSWSQVLSRELSKRISDEGKDPVIVAVDLQPMAAIDHVIQYVGDITKVETARNIIRHFNPSSGSSPSHHNVKADLVVCDGAPDVTGLFDADLYIQSQLVYAALRIAFYTLSKGGTFVAKIFRGREIPLIYHQARCIFDEVICAKPKSSRGSSLEAFIVCNGFNPPEGLDLPFSMDFDEVYSSFGGNDDGKLADIELNANYVKFISCGDLDDPDPDLNYPTPEEGSLEPIAPPTVPAYTTALSMKRKGLLQ